MVVSGVVAQSVPELRLAEASAAAFSGVMLVTSAAFTSETEPLAGVSLFVDIVVIVLELLLSASAEAVTSAAASELIESVETADGGSAWELAICSVSPGEAAHALISTEGCTVCSQELPWASSSALPEETGLVWLAFIALVWVEFVAAELPDSASAEGSPSAAAGRLTPSDLFSDVLLRVDTGLPEATSGVQPLED